MTYCRHMLGQFGIQCGWTRPPYLSEPIQAIMDGYGHPKASAYEISDCFPDHLNHPNETIPPLPIWEEDHGSPCKF